MGKLVGLRRRDVKGRMLSILEWKVLEYVYVWKGAKGYVSDEQ